MANPLILKGIKVVLSNGKSVIGFIAPGIVGMAAKMGNEIIENQKSLIKIPDLKDIPVEIAFQILKEELNLIPVLVEGKPSSAYADYNENKVISSQPRFGARVVPRTTVKLYHLTQEVIDQSKELRKIKEQHFNMPKVVGLNIHEACKDLEEVGFKVTERLEKPNLKFSDKEDGQVTRVTRPDNSKIGKNINVGERVLLYYVNEVVLLESKQIKLKQLKDRQERIASISNETKKIYTNVVDNKQKIVRKLRKPFKKKHSSDKSDV